MEKSWIEFCHECKNRYIKKGNKPPCLKCKPKELPGNKIVLGIISMYGTTLINEGNLNIEAIRFAFDLEDIPNNRRGFLYQKLMIYYYTILNILEKETKNGKRS